MKKLGIFILLIIVVVAVVFITQDKDGTDTPATDQTEETTDEAAMSEADETSTPSTEEESDEANDNESGALSVESGEVSYTVMKGWFSKPTEEVTGMTSDITGSATITEENMLTGTITISTENLDSGANGRDGEVRNILGESITVSVTDASITLGEASPVTADVTIGETTASISFDVTTTMEEGAYTLSGTASFNMVEDFSIDPPSIADLYSVDEEASLSFDITLS